MGPVPREAGWEPETGKGEAWVAGGSSHFGLAVEVQVGSALDPAPASLRSPAPGESHLGSCRERGR